MAEKHRKSFVDLKDKIATFKDVGEYMTPENDITQTIRDMGMGDIVDTEVSAKINEFVDKFRDMAQKLREDEEAELDEIRGPLDDGDPEMKRFSDEIIEKAKKEIESAINGGLERIDRLKIVKDEYNNWFMQALGNVGAGESFTKACEELEKRRDVIANQFLGIGNTFFNGTLVRLSSYIDLNISKAHDMRKALKESTKRMKTIEEGVEKVKGELQDIPKRIQVVKDALTSIRDNGREICEKEECFDQVVGDPRMEELVKKGRGYIKDIKDAVVSINRLLEGPSIKIGGKFDAPAFEKTVKSLNSVLSEIIKNLGSSDGRAKEFQNLKTNISEMMSTLNNRSKMHTVSNTDIYEELYNSCKQSINLVVKAADEGRRYRKGMAPEHLLYLRTIHEMEKVIEYYNALKEAWELLGKPDDEELVVPGIEIEKIIEEQKGVVSVAFRSMRPTENAPSIEGDEVPLVTPGTSSQTHPTGTQPREHHVTAPLTYVPVAPSAPPPSPPTPQSLFGQVVGASTEHMNTTGGLNTYGTRNQSQPIIAHEQPTPFGSRTSSEESIASGIQAPPQPRSTMTQLPTEHVTIPPLILNTAQDPDVSTENAQAQAQKEVLAGGALGRFIDKFDGLGKAQICCAVLVVLMGLQFGSRILRVPHWICKMLGWISYLGAIILPLMHGAFIVYMSCKMENERRGDDARGVREMLRRNAGVVAWMVPMLGVLGDFRRMKSAVSGDLTVDGKPMAVGGHGVLAAMTAIAIWGQKMLGASTNVSPMEVCVIVAGDAAVLSMYCVQGIAPGLGRKHNVVPLAYMAFGAAVCVMAVILWLCARGMNGRIERVGGLMRWIIGKSSRRLQSIGIGASFMSMAFIVAGMLNPEWRCMGYRGGIKKGDLTAS